MEKNRLYYFDMLRGLAILGVIAIHASNVGFNFPSDTFNFNFTIFWRNSLNFSVPLFLAISGYFLAKKEVSDYNKYFDFLKKQIPKIYIPLLIWSSLWFAINVFTGNSPIPRELIKIITFRSSVPYYFIALISQFYIALPFLKKLNNKRGLLISVLVSLTITLVIFYLRYFTEIRLPVLLYGGNMFTFWMFFQLGLFLGSGNILNISNKILLLLIAFFYFISCSESYILITFFEQASDAVTAVKFSSFLYSFFIIFYLLKNIDVIKSKSLTLLGNLSFGIFLTHLFFLEIVNQIAFAFFPSIVEITYLYQFLAIIIVASACVITMVSVNKFMPAKYGRLLGFF